jgi:hypothetical protein
MAQPRGRTNLTGAAGEYYISTQLSERGRHAAMSITNAPEMEILDKQQATARCQARMRVRHEHLPGVDGLDTSMTVPKCPPGQGPLLPL